MSHGGRPVTGKVLNVSLEIVSLLTGENYVVAKKKQEPRSSRHVSEGPPGAQSPSPVPPSHPRIRKRNHEQKILELSNKMIQLLNGEVPVRCDDVTVYFSKEKNSEGLKDEKAKSHQPLSSLGNGSSTAGGSHTPANPPNSDGINKQEPEPSEDVKPEDDITASCEERRPGEVEIKEEEYTSFLIKDEPESGEEGSLSDEDIDRSASVKEEAASELVGGETSCAERTCPLCGKEFTYKADLILHEREHTGEKSLMCPICMKGCTTKPHLATHLRIHTGEKPFGCPKCGERFINMTCLVRHEQKNHREEKSCAICGKCFNRTSNLLTHLRVHRGEKPFQCSECEKSFSKKSNLAAHQKIHRGVKPYECSECGKRFARNSHLVTHRRIHTGEEPFRCEVCGKRFKRSSNLLAHEKIHLGVKSSQCSECGKGFIDQSSLSRHRKIHLREKESAS